ncbi:hypothetical protein F441_08963 [Phytophthora nicotianae CJ01A1]|uniref:Uncharacterized protein n=1 Tax=Phytophthora nicotianae CJ01A1 TaxID=1317063 RepID=W2X0V0_PHYNI|nr:hypothetical protein F441_08963 [Phytophthora nicotianae CJ01A1]
MWKGVTFTEGFRLGAVRPTARNAERHEQLNPGARVAELVNEFSFDTSRLSLQRVEGTLSEVPTATPASASFGASDRSGGGVPPYTTRHPSPRLVERGNDVPANVTSEGLGTMRARTTEMPTRRAGTPTTNSGLQEIPVGTFSRALQRLSVAAGTSTGVPPSEEVMPVSPSGPMVPWVTLPALASTPVRMPLTAIPPYGGVTTQVDSTNRNDGGNGATRLSALYLLFQHPISPTAGWSSGGTLPAWSSAPANQTPASMISLETSRSFSVQGGGYQTRPVYPRVSGIGTLSGQNAPILGIPTELQKAVKVIVPFYSDTATSERAATFWRLLEKFPQGIDGQKRLSAFEQCLKGKAEEWWYNCRIDSFETQQVNRFIC